MKASKNIHFVPCVGTLTLLSRPCPAFKFSSLGPRPPIRWESGARSRTQTRPATAIRNLGQEKTLPPYLPVRLRRPPVLPRPRFEPRPPRDTQGVPPGEGATAEAPNSPGRPMRREGLMAAGFSSVATEDRERRLRWRRLLPTVDRYMERQVGAIWEEGLGDEGRGWRRRRD